MTGQRYDSTAISPREAFAYWRQLADGGMSWNTSPELKDQIAMIAMEQDRREPETAGLWHAASVATGRLHCCPCAPCADGRGER